MSNNPITDFFSIFDEGRKIAQTLIDIRDNQKKQLQAIQQQQQQQQGGGSSATGGTNGKKGTSTGKGNASNGTFNANTSLANIEKDVREIAKKLGVKENNLSKKGSSTSGTTSGLTSALVDEQKREWTKFFDGLRALFDSFKVVVMNLLDAWGKVDQAAYDFQKTLGGSGAAAKAMRANTIDTVVNRHIGDRFNTTSDELIKLEQTYDKEIGRRASLTNNERESLAAMNALMGTDRAGDIAKAYEKFGKNIEGAGTAAARLYKDASKNGVAFEKYSQNVVQNLKLAQSYNFANGTRGLEEMAMKATALKLDMQSVAQMADKVSTVEGATTAAANLSVLGGSFAGFSNPMSMLYEGLNDVGALTDRVTEMFGDLAYFNKETGEVDMSAFNKQRVRAAAQAAGMSSDALMDMIYTKARINQLEPEISGLNVSDEVKNLLKNTAQIGEDGKGYVTINGQEKKLSQITNNDLEALKKLNQTEGDNIKEIAEILRGWNDSVSGMEKQYEANKAQITELSGLGELSKGIVQAIGSSNTLLTAILATLSILTIGGGIAAFAGGIKALGGPAAANAAATTGPTATGNAATGAGMAATGAGQFANKAFLGKGVANSLASGVKPGFGSRFGGAMGSAGAIGGGVLAGGLTAYNEFTGENKYKHGLGEKASRTLGSGVGAWGGAAAGAALGSFLGPIGTVIGGLAGGIVGAIGGEAGGGALGRLIGMSDSEKAEFKRHYGLEGLLGDYTAGELQDILAHRTEGKAIDASLRRKMEDAGDTEFYAQGGVVGTGIAQGPSHVNGGIQGTSQATGKVVEFEGGEMILSREDTKMFLQAATAWKDYVKSTPREGEYNPVKVDDTRRANEVGGTIKIEPMDIKISGTIKLEGTGGQSANLDVNKLLQNRPFIDKLADIMFTYIQKHKALGKDGEMNYRKYGTH